MLMLIGINAIHQPKDLHTDGGGNIRGPTASHVYRFTYGPCLGVQTWLVICGIALGLLGYGFSEAYVHLFDWWCTRKGLLPGGLDYGRYLNSLPRAPVTYGIRGFYWLVSLRYSITLITIVASVGYKFGIFEVEVHIGGDVDQQFILLQPPATRLFRKTDVSPWLVETMLAENGSLSDHNSAFSYEAQPGGLWEGHFLKAPAAISMAAVANYSPIEYPQTRMDLDMREVILVASLTEDEESLIMTWDDPEDRRRIRTSSSLWVSPEEEGEAVVDYRIEWPDKILVKWAPARLWSDPDIEVILSSSQLIYLLRYAVALTKRSGNDGNCAKLENCWRLSTDDDQPHLNPGANSTFLDQYGLCIDALMASPDTGYSDGISGLVRAAMTHIASETRSDRPQLGHAPTHENLFGPEADTSQWSHMDKVTQPHIHVTGRTGTIGCYKHLAHAFLAVGIFAILVFGLRIWVGPPRLTTWTGQHVYLAQAGYLVDTLGKGSLLTGYEVAGKDLGRLRLSGYDLLPSKLENEK